MNQFIEEDFERILALDSMYIYEKLMEEEEEYWRWEENEQRLPARIEIVTYSNKHRRRINKYNNENII